MYNVFEYLKIMRSFKTSNNNTKQKILQCDCSIPSKNEPYETDKPVPQRFVCC